MLVISLLLTLVTPAPQQGPHAGALPKNISQRLDIAVQAVAQGWTFYQARADANGMVYEWRREKQNLTITVRALESPGAAEFEVRQIAKWLFIEKNELRDVGDLAVFADAPTAPAGRTNVYAVVGSVVLHLNMPSDLTVAHGIARRAATELAR